MLCLNNSLEKFAKNILFSFERKEMNLKHDDIY